MIYVGYQGIGKSTLAKDEPEIIDLESSNFVIDGKKIENWEVIYCNIAKHLSNQGKTVFVSCHNEVRDYLKKHNIEYYCIFPDIKLKADWLNKLRERFNRTQSDKDWKALNRSIKYYDGDISELMNYEDNKIIIDNIAYDLKNIIILNELKRNNK